ncbi:peptidylprolyl isomerase [Tamlana fucoidanivorans]|uniref:PpiC domain-containing protein n=1 Tax=Allotamlana fucoidanivorans TaxID=2583814 RepID=A0A5C4SQP1_9FLAO|nr:peptidylprolyl isomerase [Tamlana fucoidanivorans]TNJ46628.1 hypothetical protein FGF67_03055 [Tamlana fucoidanivorans]
MLKQLPTLLFLGIATSCFTQTSTEDALNLIHSEEQAKSYLTQKPSKQNKLITFNEEKHKTILAKELFKTSIGITKIFDHEFETIFYKVMTKSRKTYYRGAIIHLNGENLEYAAIEALQKTIMDKYKNGASFDFLAKQYSIDNHANKGGDLGWFLSGDKHVQLETSIIEHDLGDIFALNIEHSNDYYVVLKTHEPKEISEIEVLKIVEQKY